MICLLLYILGILSGAIGMILTWIVTFIPQWRLVVLAENNGFVVEGGRIDGEWLSRWDGLWMTCLSQRRFPLQCNDYGSRVSLTNDFKAARVFMGFGIAIAVLACLFSLVGIVLSGCCCCSPCSRCCRDSCENRRCLFLASGILYLLTVVLILIPVIWVIINISYGAYDARLTQGAVKLEIGEALMLVWPTLVFLLVGGLILSATSCCCGSLCGTDLNTDCEKTSCGKSGGYQAPRDQDIIQRKMPCEGPRRSSPGMLYI